MTFKMPVDGRTFLPDNAELVAVVGDKQRGAVNQPAPRSSYEAELAAYRKDRDINAIMRQRHGVNM